MRKRAGQAGTAVAELFRLHADDVYRFVARRIGEHGAADATADVFRIALTRWETFDGRRGLARARLFGIAANVVRDHWRSERRRQHAHTRAGTSVESAIDPLLAVEDRIVAEDQLRAVHAALQLLSPVDRDLVTMFAWEGCSYREIAVALGVPIGTVRSRLNRIRLDLTASLDPQEEP